jgi:hypothetical protein
MNAYGFAGGDRINFSDPMGLSPCCIPLAGVNEALRKAVDEIPNIPNSIVVGGEVRPIMTGFAPDMGGGAATARKNARSSQHKARESAKSS